MRTHWLDGGEGAVLTEDCRSYERPRLNERFLYLVFFSVFIGVFRGCAHVYYDRARLVFPEVPYASYKDAGAAQIPTVAWNVGYYVSFFSIFGPLVYFPFRYILWSHTLAFARHFYWYAWLRFPGH